MKTYIVPISLCLPVEYADSEEEAVSMAKAVLHCAYVDETMYTCGTPRLVSEARPRPPVMDMLHPQIPEGYTLPEDAIVFFEGALAEDEKQKVIMEYIRGM